MTEKLYYNDSHMTSFNGIVLSCQHMDEQYKVVLDRTAFFPEGGGQYADTGFIDDVEVVDAKEEDGIIYHYTLAPIEVGKEVHGTLNKHLRFTKMQQHSGEHIVSGLINRRFGYDNVGFHLGSEDCTMDFNGNITKEELREIEMEANKAVVKNLNIEVVYPTDKELKDIDYRSKKEIDGQVRIVEIPGYDICACCAPHVSKTGEIGIIRLTNVQRYKGGVRVTMLCGFRALQDYRVKEDNVKAVSEMLCAKEYETAKAVERLKDENSSLKIKLAKAKESVIKSYAKELCESDNECIWTFEEDLEGDEPRILMNCVIAEGKNVCGVFLKTGEDEYRYVVGCKEGNVRDLAKELNSEFQGRGGGKPEMVQGSLKGNKDVIEAFLNKKAGSING